MNIKKITAIFLTFLTLCGLFSAGASAYAPLTAEEEISLSYPVLHNSPSHLKNSVSALKEYVSTDELKEYLLGEISLCKTTVSLREFDIPWALNDCIYDFIWCFLPEAFNVYGIGASSSYGKIDYIVLSYNDFSDTAEEYSACYGLFLNEADKLLSGIENNSSLSDTEKALLLHDRLAIHTEYNFETGIDMRNHSAYGALARKTAVCQGYAMAYMYLLQRVGIENYYCSSESLNHGWNIVYIGGKAYHVDVTWDDSAAWGYAGNGISGRVYHDNFLRSTNGIIETEHTASDFDMSPTDTTYDDYFWQDSDTQFVLVENNIYYIDSAHGQLKNMRTGEKLCDVSDSWKISASSSYVGNYSCLAAGGAELLYSLSDGIYKYSPKTKTSQKIYTPDLKPYYHIYGFTYEDGNLICEINNTLHNADNLTRLKVPFSDIVHTICKIEIITPPVKTLYYIGDSLDSWGLKVRLHYTDGTTETLSEGFTVSDFSSDTAGKKTVYISHKGFSDSFTVEVRKPEIKLSATSADVTENGTLTLQALTKPEGAAVVWSSSVPSAASVSGGTIKGLKAGKTVITASFTYNGHTYSASADINILCAHSNSTLKEKIPATCKNTGYSEGKYCNYCEKYVSGHTVLAIDKNNHINTKAVPAIAPTAEKSGYTEGVFCNDCQQYISGHSEIPKLQPDFTDSENARIDGIFILVNAGLTAKEILGQCSADTKITDSKGNTVEGTALIGTGMTLTFSGGKNLNLSVRGDIDGDGKISASDARLALRASVGLEKLTPAQEKAADIDKSTTITAADARLILRASVELEKISI